MRRLVLVASAFCLLTNLSRARRSGVDTRLAVNAVKITWFRSGTWKGIGRTIFGGRITTTRSTLVSQSSVRMDEAGSLVDPAMIDRALEQTRVAGMAYACVPLPCWNEWFRIVERGHNAFQWWATCGLPGYNFDVAMQDDDGNVWWCMLDPDHVGPHFIRRPKA